MSSDPQKGTNVDQEARKITAKSFSTPPSQTQPQTVGKNLDIGLNPKSFQDPSVIGGEREREELERRVIQNRSQAGGKQGSLLSTGNRSRRVSQTSLKKFDISKCVSV